MMGIREHAGDNDDTVDLLDIDVDFRRELSAMEIAGQTALPGGSDP